MITSNTSAAARRRRETSGMSKNQNASRKAARVSRDSTPPTTLSFSSRVAANNLTVKATSSNDSMAPT